MYSKENLLKALTTDKEIASVWAAYQLLTLFPKESSDYLELFLDNPLQDIQLAGIAKIGESEAAEFAPRLLYLFRESSSSIKQAAAVTLSKFPNDLSISVINRWFEDLVSGNDATRNDLHSATNAYLNCAPQEHLKRIIETIHANKSDLIKASILFQGALRQCSEKACFDQLMDLYFQLRDLHSDTELSLQLMHLLGHEDLVDWLLNKMDQGFSLISFYEQSYQLLGKGISLKERQIWDGLQAKMISLEKSDKSIETVEDFLSVLKQWTNLYQDNANLNPLQNKILWLIQGFYRNSEYFFGTIPKILDIEKSLLSVLPVVFQMEASMKEWMDNPRDFLDEIAEYYHSFLLTLENREKILKLFFPQAPAWDPEVTKIHDEVQSRLDDSIHQIIWDLYRGELLGKNISWPTLFPNPDVSLHLTACLQQIYLSNFNWFIETGDRLSIDYALQLFQANPDEKMIDAMTRHFPYLQQHHTEVFYQAIEFLPSPKFLEPLVQIYQPGEYEVSDLIWLICEIFDLSIPENLLGSGDLDDFSLQRSALAHRVRLHCSECNHTYKYPVSNIYVDEEALLRYNDLQSESVWVDKTFVCKNCSADLPFKLDYDQLEEIASQSRMDKFLRTPSLSSFNALGKRIRTIPFPQFNGEIYNPDTFEALIQFHEEQETSPSVLNALYLRQAKLLEILQKWPGVLKTLEKADPETSDKVEILTRTGIAAYKLDDFFKARTCLQEVLRIEEEVAVDEREIVFVMDAGNYLDLMKDQTMNKSRFKVIRGNK